MAMMAFFPWFTIEAPLTFGEYRLYPHSVGTASTHGVPAAIENCINHYRDAPNRPVRRVTVLQLGKKPLGEDFSDTERADIFEFNEMLAMASLSKRLFYRQVGSNYTNRDTISGTIQGYRENEGGVGIRVRGRDGFTLSYYTADVYQVLRPPHIRANQSAVFDEALVNALLAAQTAGSYENFESAISSFNRANTDSDQVTEQIEIIHQNGAFEALFNLGGGNEVGLTRAFMNCLANHVDANQGTSQRQHARFPNDPPAREAWIRDLFRTRGSVAHGRAVVRYPAVWAMKEHLLLGAFIFPICLKLELERGGFYTLTVEDRKTIFTLDRLLRSENLDAQVPGADEDPNDPYAAMDRERDWTRIEREASDHLRRERAIAAFEGRTPDRGDV